MRFMLLCLVVISQFTFARNEDGNSHGGGGDLYAVEFVDTAYEVLAHVNRLKIKEIDRKAFADAINDTLVESKEYLELEGIPKDAINYPDKKNPRIEICRSCWERTKNNIYQRWVLVLHEYLGIMGVNDKSYQVSRLIDSAKICDRSQGVREAIEKFFNLECFRLVYDDLARIKRLPVYPTEDFKDGDLNGMTGLEDFDAQSWTEVVKIPPGLFTAYTKMKQVRWLNGNDLPAGLLPEGIQIGNLILTPMNGMNTVFLKKDGLKNVSAQLLLLGETYASHNATAPFIEPGAFNGTSANYLQINNTLLPAVIAPAFFQGIQGVSTASFTGNGFNTYEAGSLAPFVDVYEFRPRIDWSATSADIFNDMTGLTVLRMAGINMQEFHGQSFESNSRLRTLTIQSEDSSIPSGLIGELQGLGFNCTEPEPMKSLSCTRAN